MTFLENTFLVVSFVCLLNILFIYPENYHIRGYYNLGFVNGIFFILVFFLTNEHYNNSVVNVQQSKNQIYKLTIKRGVQTPSYDIFYTFIIVANSENKARQIAQQKSYGDETKFIDDFRSPDSRSIEKRIDFWTDSKKTDCVLVNTDKEEKVCGCFMNG